MLQVAQHNTNILPEKYISTTGTLSSSHFKVKVHPEMNAIEHSLNYTYTHEEVVQSHCSILYVITIVVVFFLKEQFNPKSEMPISKKI